MILKKYEKKNIIIKVGIKVEIESTLKKILNTFLLGKIKKNN